MDTAGKVDAVGVGVDHLSVGAAVMAVVNVHRPASGAQAEMIVVPAASVVAIPDGINAVAAATLSMNGLASESSLAVTGGAGGLGSYVVALVKRRRLRLIADTKPSDEALAVGSCPKGSTQSHPLHGRAPFRERAGCPVPPAKWHSRLPQAVQRCRCRW